MPKPVPFGLSLLALAAVSLAVALPPLHAEAVRLQQGDDVIALQNSHCRLELDADTGEIEALKPGPPSLRGPWFEVVEEDRTGLQPWETWEHGQEDVFASGPVDVTGVVIGGVGQAKAAWARPNGIKVEGEVSLGPDDPGPRFRLKVSNGTGSALVDTIRLPVLRGITLGDAEDDWFTWPHTLGARFRVQGFGPGEKLQHAYPDFMYMQWLDLHDQSRGVYVGCLDDYGYCKELFVGRDEDARSLMGINFVGCWIAEQGDSWTTPWVEIASHSGDWRAGADIYRRFAEAAFGPLDPPQRVWDMPTAQCWLAHHGSDAEIGKLFEVQQQAPIHASYLMKSLNTSVPEGWDGFRGSALEMEQSFARIRGLGGSPALFTFDRAPLMGRPNYAECVARWTSQRRDGSFAEGFRDLMPAPFDPDLVRARVGEAVRWVRAFGIDEIHYDTAATTSASLAGPSYHPDSPQRPNEVPHYFKALYRSIRDECRKHNPEFLLRAEHCADFFFPEFLTSTAHFFETGRLVAAHGPPTDAQLMPILFRYTLPRHAILEMPSMSDDDFWAYGYGMGYGFHGGGPSWCFNPGVREAESPPGELLHRYRFYDDLWLKYYGCRVGATEAVIEGYRADEIAEAEIDGEWRRCSFPGPLIAVTHVGEGIEVTLGQWNYLSHTRYFGEQFVGDDRMKPRPVRLRVPTGLTDPEVRLWGVAGPIETEAKVVDGMVSVDIPDPTTFALEVLTGPTLDLSLQSVAVPGERVETKLRVRQPEPREGQIAFSLPAGWPAVEPVPVPAQREFDTTVPIQVPPGIFGRNYPVKAVLRCGDLKRTTAGTLRVMEQVTVLYSFDTLGEEGPLGLHCIEPGKPARLTVTCVNNIAVPVETVVQVSGEQVAGEVSERLAAAPDLGDPDSPLARWIEGKGDKPDNVLIATFDFDCTGVPSQPVSIRVIGNDSYRPFDEQVWPRTRLMDLNGEWKVGFMRRSQTKVGGAERQGNLDTEAVTPEVWDGEWESHATPIRFEEQVRKDHSWAIYRRLVYVPPEWQGADVWLRLNRMGAPWGLGGTLNIVYVNGWPTGRIGASGECSLTSFLVFGGWNLLAVASMSPNSLVEPYLFVRDAPAPERLEPVPAPERPEGAFLLLGPRPTGQGLSLVFIKGVPEGDCRRTDLAQGGEHTFIYLAIADAFLREPDGPVEIDVEYLDRGTAPFGLAYDSTDESAPINGAFKDAPAVRRTDTGEWKTYTFVLPDARLANRQHQGADLRLWAQDDDLHVRRVEVRRGEEVGGE